MDDKAFLSFVTFRTKLTHAKEFKIEKEQFPISIIAKPNALVRGELSFNNNLNYERNGSASKSNVSRPKNQFILARIIISKLVKSVFHTCTNEGISKVISMIWSEKSLAFKRYFQYLSSLEEAWHESQYPYYYYQPKKVVRVLSTFRFGSYTPLASTSETEKDVQQRQSVIVKEVFRVKETNSDRFSIELEKITSKNHHQDRQASQKPKNTYYDLCSSSLELKRKASKSKREYDLSIKKFKIQKPAFIAKPAIQRRSVVKKPKNKAVNELQLRDVNPMFYMERIEDICIR